MSYPKAGFAWLVVSRRHEVSPEFKIRRRRKCTVSEIDWFNVVASM